MIKYLNDRTKLLNIIDIGLIKITVFFVAIAIVKLFPQLLTLRYSVLLVLIIICVIRPLYTYFLKK